MMTIPSSPSSFSLSPPPGPDRQDRGRPLPGIIFLFFLPSCDACPTLLTQKGRRGVIWGRRGSRRRRAGRPTAEGAGGTDLWYWAYVAPHVERPPLDEPHGGETESRRRPIRPGEPPQEPRGVGSMQHGPTPVAIGGVLAENGPFHSGPIETDCSSSLKKLVLRDT